MANNEVPPENGNGDPDEEQPEALSPPEFFQERIHATTDEYGHDKLKDSGLLEGTMGKLDNIGFDIKVSGDLRWKERLYLLGLLEEFQMAVLAEHMKTNVREALEYLKEKIENSSTPEELLLQETVCLKLAAREEVKKNLPEEAVRGIFRLRGRINEKRRKLRDGE